MAEPEGGAAAPAAGTTPAAGGDEVVSFNNATEHSTHVNTNWRNFVDKEYGEHSSTANLSSLNDVVKSYINAQQMVGAEKIAKPNEKWSQDDWKQFYRAGGMPETEDGYKVGRPESAPENYPYNPEEEKSFKNQAYQNGLSVNQANALWNQRHERRIAAWNEKQTTTTHAQKEGWTKLKSELGETFDTKVKNANAVLARFDGDGEVRKYLQKTGMINDPTIAKFVMRIADNFAEDTVGTQQRTSGGLTPSQYRSKARELQGKIRSMTRGSFEHEQALSEYVKLQELAAGGK